MECKEMAKRIAEMIKYEQDSRAEGRKMDGNLFHAKWKGMEEALEIMGIPVLKEHSDPHTITAVIVEAYRAEVI